MKSRSIKGICLALFTLISTGCGGTSKDFSAKIESWTNEITSTDKTNSTSTVDQKSDAKKVTEKKITPTVDSKQSQRYERKWEDLVHLSTQLQYAS